MKFLSKSKKEIVCALVNCGRTVSKSSELIVVEQNSGANSKHSFVIAITGGRLERVGTVGTFELCNSEIQKK